MNINKTQLNLLEAILISDEGMLNQLKDGVAETTSLLAFKALENLITDTEFRKRYLFSQKNLTLFKSAGILETVNQIRDIILHPAPQNRNEDYPYFGADADPSYVIYKNPEGNPAKELRGLLSLSAKNDIVTPPIDKKAVIDFLLNCLRNEISQLEKKIPRCESYNRFNFFKELSYELQIEIASHLNMQDILKLTQTDKALSAETASFLKANPSEFELLAYRGLEILKKEGSEASRTFHESIKNHRFGEHLTYFFIMMGFPDDDLQIILSCYPNLKFLVIMNFDNVIEGTCFQNGGHKIEELRLVSLQDFKNLANLKSLKKLVITNKLVLSSHSLHRLPSNLESCSFFTGEISSENLTTLFESCPKLSELKITCVSFSDSNIHSLSSNLRMFEVRGSFNITDEGLENLPLGLKKLSISLCNRITENGLKNLKQSRLDLIIEYNNNFI
ncbi:MAG: hypothetical protein H0U27_15130 [Nitrosopumilus sp.]|nr:hypothetical protein [Nitrosopumilus sp.]